MSCWQQMCAPQQSVFQAEPCLNHFKQYRFFAIIPCMAMHAADFFVLLLACMRVLYVRRLSAVPYGMSIPVQSSCNGVFSTIRFHMCYCCVRLGRRVCVVVAELSSLLPCHISRRPLAQLVCFCCCFWYEIEHPPIC